METFGAFLRDPDNYAVTVFGTPGPEAPWGWRLEGHHLSLNVTIVPGRAIAVTPAFLGANPAEVPSGPLQGLRVLRDEQDLGLALARGLDSAQRAHAVIASASLGERLGTINATSARAAGQVRPPPRSLPRPPG
jgi:Protein of unknown function (DUF3500)